MIEAAKWHDVENPMKHFRTFLGVRPHEGIWGRSPESRIPVLQLGKDGEKQARPFFRHEPASALAHMAYGKGRTRTYHHWLRPPWEGTSIRSIPSERSEPCPLPRNMGWYVITIHSAKIEIQLISPLNG